MKFTRHALTAVGLAVLLSACGGGGSSSSATGSSTTSATMESTAAVSTSSTTSGARGSYTSAPVITTQPVSQSVQAGTAVSFSVVAYGAATLSYQWRKDGVAIDGATSAKFSVSSVQASDAGSYDVVVTNSKGTATSASAILSVQTSTAASGALTGEVVSATQAFLGTLSTTQQATAQPAWALDTARKWSNLPAAMVARNGVSWGSLSAAQKVAARTLIATALGSTGNTLHLGMLAADNYLYSIGGGSTYGENNYYIAVLGTPSTSGFWVLQLTGHHNTFNLSFNGSYRSATPAFLGVEPKASFTYGGTTYDPMQAQRVAFSNLGAALTNYASAKLSGTYADLVFGANGSGGIDGTCPRAYSSVTSHGLPYASLSATDQALAQAAIKAYVNTQATELSDELLAAYLSDTALANTYVAYAGSGTVTTSGNYFRIEGPRLWIEFSVQGGVIIRNDIHYHTVWRDKLADYGGLCGTS